MQNTSVSRQTIKSSKRLAMIEKLQVFFTRLLRRLRARDSRKLSMLLSFHQFR